MSTDSCMSYQTSKKSESTTSGDRMDDDSSVELSNSFTAKMSGQVSSPNYLTGGPQTTLTRPKKTSCIPGPPTMKYIIINEACERFSYYALRSILFMYLSDMLGFPDSTALAICTGTIAIAYASPLFGGYISDSYWGKYKTIVIFSFFYVISAAILAASALNYTPWMALLGLVGIALATGGIKPCVSAFGADQFLISSGSLDTYFSVFYMTINIASLCSFIIIPIIRSEVSYFAAFALPSLMLFISILVFIIPTRSYTYVEPTGSLLVRLWPAIKFVFWTNSHSPNRILEAEICFGIEEARMVESLTIVLPVFMFLPMFWCVYDLQSGAWQAQAKSMNLEGFQLEQIGALNTILILILIPLLDQCIYPALQRKGYRVGHIARLNFGMICTFFGMVTVALLQYWIDLSPPDSISIFYQVPQYVFMSLAEALISVTALTYAYENAPMELKTVMSSFNLCTSAIGNLCSTLVFAVCQGVGNGDVSLLQQFSVFTALIAFNVVGLRFFISRSDRQNFKRLDDSDRETRELLQYCNKMEILGENEGETST